MSKSKPLSRRSVLSGGLGLAGSGALMATGASGTAHAAGGPQPSERTTA
ncbi:hypothetical protein [Streptomyces sp. CT34]|nr:hypothetical protein [Streptomyces sp. CT34]